MLSLPFPLLWYVYVFARHPHRHRMSVFDSVRVMTRVSLLHVSVLYHCR